MTKFTEEKLEQVFIELLGQEGIPHFLGSSITRNDDSACAGTADREVLIEEDLKSFLLNKYKKENLTNAEIERIIRQLKNYPSSDLYESNKAIMKLVVDGFILKRDLSASNGQAGNRIKKDIYIQLIDYSGITKFQKPAPKNLKKVIIEKQAIYGSDKNIYKFVNQLEITGTEKRIPDGILYINGLPLVVFEFKSAIREEATIYDAYVQLTIRYKRDIPELFKYNAFCVISNGVNNKAGSFFAPYEFYYGWRRTSHPHPRPHSQGEKGVEGSITSGRGGGEGCEIQYSGGFDFSGLVSIARELRKNQTSAEEIMWELVRNHRFMNLKIRRQHQIGDYIVDFYCHEHKLVLELDGEVHLVEKQAKKDHKRDAYLKSLGFTILRFKNDEFLLSPEKTLL